MSKFYNNFISYYINFMSTGFHGKFEHDFKWESSKAVWIISWFYSQIVFFVIMRLFMSRSSLADLYICVTIVCAVIASWLAYKHYCHYPNIPHSVIAKHHFTTCEKLIVVVPVICLPVMYVLLLSV